MSSNPGSRQGSTGAGAAGLVERLGGLFLFRGWDREDLQSLGRISHVARHPKEHLLFHQGDSCDCLHVVLSGRVQMFRGLPDGREVTLHVLGPGALVACVALFLDKCFPASARILSPTADLLALDGKPFLALLAERPDLSRKLIGALAARISDLADRIESRTADTAMVRLAGWILDQTSVAGTEGERVVRVEGSKKSVAASLGMTPETFSRMLRSLAEQRILSVRHREIVLHDPARLTLLKEGQS